ncbi:MAG: amidohydrolase family protein [Myxococcota bacterium]
MLTAALLSVLASADPTLPHAVDTHVHVSPAEYDRAVALFDTVGVDWALNLSGGWPSPRLDRHLGEAKRTGRFAIAVNLPWRYAGHPRFTELCVAILEEATRRGVRALKIQKALGLGVLDPEGQRLPVDSPRLDAIWRRAGELGLPVVIHTADPKAFWDPVTPDNERYAELSAHPGWSYYGEPVPSFHELLAELERVIARHPDTVFISVHFGNHAEDPKAVARTLDRYPNLFVDLAARIVELGRQKPSELRDLFVRHRDRILFGTDLGLWRNGGIMLGSTGEVPDSDADVPGYFSAHQTWLETSETLPSPVPIQGTWPLSGLSLPRLTLRRIYRDNAEMLFGPPPSESQAARRYPPYFREL